MCCICHRASPTPQINHIDGNPANNSEDNLIPLCPNHHSLVHTKFALTQNITPQQLKMYREKWFFLCEQKDRSAAGLPVEEVPTEWVVTYGLNVSDLIEEGDLPADVPYYKLCDDLEKDLDLSLRAKKLRGLEMTGDERNGETLSVRYRFEYDPLSEPEPELVKGIEIYWELLEFLPFRDVYPEG